MTGTSKRYGIFTDNFSAAPQTTTTLTRKLAPALAADRHQLPKALGRLAGCGRYSPTLVCQPYLGRARLGLHLHFDHATNYSFSR